MLTELLEGEKILKKTAPHPLSFWPYYVFFAYYIIVSALIILNYDSIINSISGSLVKFLGDLGVMIIFLVLWWLLIIIPAAIYSILKISWRWLIIYTIIGIIGTYWILKLNATVFDLLYLTIGIAFFGIVLTEIYRRGHEYIITNHRIITRQGFLGFTERDIFYSRIVDVFLLQGVLGRIFNYGTIIPITAAGIGTGEDVAAVTVGIGVKEKLPASDVGAGTAIHGSKGVRVPRGRSSFILYGIPDPEEVHKVITENIQKKEPTTYLARQVELLEKLTGEKKDEK